MKIIVGLGNPGMLYRGTRHNVGFLVLDQLSRTYHIPLSERRFRALYGTGQIATYPVVLAKPLGYMNRSGEAVKRIVGLFRAAMEDLIVIHDDLDLSFGRLRFKRRGGDGGHQGVRSIIETLGGNQFARLKVGIGRPPRGMDPADYVLMPFEAEEEPHLETVFSRAADALGTMLSEGIEKAMDRVHLLTPPS